MNEQELIYTITAAVLLTIITVSLIVFIFMVGLEKAKLENKKIKLEIKKLEQDIDYYEEKKEFVKTQTKRMEQKSK